MERPLADDVARPARAYLAALVPAGEVSDAWHELLDDVAYWGDRTLLPVLRLAHQVVLQHERVTPEVAALVLDELGVHDPADVAAVLETDRATAAQWVAQAEASRDGDVAPPPAATAVGRFADPARAPGTEGRPRPPADVDEPHDDEPIADEPVADQPVADQPVADERHDDEDGPGEPDGDGAAGPEAVRIGFDDDGPLPYAAMRDDGARPRVTTRWILVAALVLWVVVLVLWALAR